MLMLVMSDEEILDWLKNKKVTTRKKLFLVLGERGGLGVVLLSRLIHFHRVHVGKTLAKMKIDGYVKQKNHKWYLTRKGLKYLKSYKKYGSIPTRIHQTYGSIPR